MVRNVKSPTETTIYAPALNLTPDKNPKITAVDKVPAVVMDKNIAEFIQNIRLETENENQVDQSVVGMDPRANETPQPGPCGRQETTGHEQVHAMANRLVVEADQQKINVEPPAGKQLIGKEKYSDQVDDKFFHVTCHVDLVTKAKIEAGKFVELEKLLVKDWPFTKPGSDNRMSLFTKDGVAYFAPVMEKEAKISNIRKWEQAFWVYAAIYSKANPGRASEIWQYVHTINSAATSCVWSNVAEYDFTFRQLMAEYPDRSWAKTFLQGWNLIMHDAIPKDNQQNQSSYKGFNKDNICWPFNKGNCSDTSCIKTINVAIVVNGGMVHTFAEREKGREKEVTVMINLVCTTQMSNQLHTTNYLFSFSVSRIL